MNGAGEGIVKMGDDPPRARASLASLVLRFLVMGAIGFGGGMANIALMERELVRKRGVISDEEFLHGVGFGQLLGPFATNSAFFVGCRLFGPLGGILCAAAFMAPSVILVIVFAWLYFVCHSIPSLQAAVGGVGPVVIALILAAAWSLGRKALLRLPAAVVALLALALSLLKVNAVYVLAGAGVLGLALGRSRFAGPRSSEASGRGEGTAPGATGAAPSSTIPPLPAAGLQLGGAAAAAPVAGGGVGLAALSWTFLKVGFVFFGGGFVLIPILLQKLVTQLHWLNNREFLDGVAIINLTPGSIAVLATFAGFHLHGVAGALAQTRPVQTSPAASEAQGPSRLLLRADGRMILDRCVHEPTVGAAGEDLDTQLAEHGSLADDRRQFGGSDEGEVAGVEAEEDPLPPEIGELDVLEASLVEGRGLEVGGLFSHHHRHPGLLSRRARRPRRPRFRLRGEGPRSHRNASFLLFIRPGTS